MTSKSTQLLSAIELDLEKELGDDASREEFVRRWARVEFASAIRTMRKRRRLQQREVAAQAQMEQSAVSRLEQEAYEAWSFKTLVRIATVLRARPRFWLEPLEDVISAHKEADACDAVVLVQNSTTDDAATVSDDDWQSVESLTKTDTAGSVGYSSTH